jgi:hypothetical protein
VRRPWAVVTPLLLALVGCSGGDGDASDARSPTPTPNDALCLDVPRSDRPVIELIEDAIDVAAAEYDDAVEFFEISADLQRVSLIVATSDGTAEQMFYCGAGGYVPPTSLGEASGATFPGDAVDVDTDVVFDGLETELDDPDIVDFAIVGDGQGGVVYDSTVQSAAGGVLLVRLSPGGQVLGVQAE